MSRTTNSIRNIKYAVIGQILVILLTFLTRIFFVRTLSADYLGINGLFTNILSMLSLAELGVGTAINYSLYRPLAFGDQEKVKSLMRLYKKAYFIIGAIVAILGVSLTPFLGLFFKMLPDIAYLQLIYIMFVANSAISYFFSYKRALIIADQKSYISSLYSYSSTILMNLAQIGVLVIFGNFLIFLGLQIVKTLLENFLISRKADRIYPYLKEKTILPLEKEEKDKIKKNVKALITHKVGYVIVMGTDNLLISKLVGIVAVGIYSNYLLIINSLNHLVTLVFGALTSSIGNLGETEVEDKKYFVFRCINLMTFWIYGLASICLFLMFNPFIKIWLGSEYLFSSSLVFLIVFNFFIGGMRKGVITFKDAFGLYWQDRYKPIVESIINLIASIILAIKLGTAGIFLGTAISTLTTSFWIEPYVLHKHGLNKKLLPYFKSYGLYGALVLLAGGISWLAWNALSMDGILGLILTLVIALAVSNAVFILALYRTPEFKHLFAILKSRLLKR